jgi:hypothetical protein
METYHDAGRHAMTPRRPGALQSPFSVTPDLMRESGGAGAQLMARR